eukprot:scaffold63395_cov46-Phaeocystis_antarctica.AAC.1
MHYAHHLTSSSVGVAHRARPEVWARVAPTAQQLHKVTRRAASPARFSLSWSYVDHSVLRRVVEPRPSVRVDAD